MKRQNSSTTAMKADSEAPVSDQSEWYDESITGSCWRCLFSREFIYRFLTLDAWNPLTGTKWNVSKLRAQVTTDIWLTAAVFFMSEIVIAMEASYWRPIKWYNLHFCLTTSDEILVR